jgi:hypothetical protein
MQANTKKTWALLQKTVGEDQPNIIWEIMTADTHVLNQIKINQWLSTNISKKLNV